MVLDRGSQAGCSDIARTVNHIETFLNEYGFMKRAVFQSVLPILVFSIILIREITSYLLFMFPGEGILWYLSFTLGHDLLPFQILLDKVVIGFSNKVIVMSLIIATTLYGLVRKNLIIKFLTCHFALIFVCIHLFITIGKKYSISASLEPSFGNYLIDIGADNILHFCLALSLFLGCALSHLQYLERLRR